MLQANAIIIVVCVHNSVLVAASIYELSVKIISNLFLLVVHYTSQHIPHLL